MTLRAAVDRFLSCPRCANPNTRRSYAAALDKLTERLGAARPLTTITPNERADTLEQLWGQTAAATWNQRRAATASFLTWCAKNAYPPPRRCPPGSSAGPSTPTRPEPSRTPRSSGC
jgi:hypothetical protein